MTLEEKAFQLMVALVAASDKVFTHDADLLASRAYHLAHAFEDEARKRSTKASSPVIAPPVSSPPMSYAGDKEDWISYADQPKV